MNYFSCSSLFFSELIFYEILSLTAYPTLFLYPSLEPTTASKMALGGVTYQNILRIFQYVTNFIVISNWYSSICLNMSFILTSSFVLFLNADICIVTKDEHFNQTYSYNLYFYTSFFYILDDNDDIIFWSRLYVKQYFLFKMNNFQTWTIFNYSCLYL